MNAADPKSELTLGQVAMHFAVPCWAVRQLFRRNLLAEPRRLGHFRLFTEADLPRVRKALVAGGYLSKEGA